MNAAELYTRLDADFRLSDCTDNWSEINFNEYYAEAYKHRYMGLVLDNAEHIDRTYTAVFPSIPVIEKIKADKAENALLFTHHPMMWDMNRIPVFQDIPIETLKLLRERKVSLYNLHAPLDANGPFSTTVNFAGALGIEMASEFYEYHGVKVGILGTTQCGMVSELRSVFEKAVGHTVALYPYGDEPIADGKVALVAGGGNDAAIYPFLREKGINTYLTGIANMRKGYPPSLEGHKAAKECGISILAGTHYSTEKFACIKMVEYFEQLALPAEFIPDSPCMEDM